MLLFIRVWSVSGDCVGSESRAVITSVVALVVHCCLYQASAALEAASSERSVEISLHSS